MFLFRLGIWLSSSLLEADIQWALGWALGDANFYKVT